MLGSLCSTFLLSCRNPTRGIFILSFLKTIWGDIYAVLPKISAFNVKRIEETMIPKSGSTRIYVDQLQELVGRRAFLALPIWLLQGLLLISDQKTKRIIVIQLYVSLPKEIMAMEINLFFGNTVDWYSLHPWWVIAKNHLLHRFWQIIQSFVSLMRSTSNSNLFIAVVNRGKKIQMDFSFISFNLIFSN